MSNILTVGRLHAILGGMVSAGHARKRVHVDKDTYTHNLECDGAVVLGVYRCEIQVLGNIDDDGGMKFRKDGTESISTLVVLSGSGERCPTCYTVNCLLHAAGEGE